MWNQIADDDAFLFVIESRYIGSLSICRAWTSWLLGLYLRAPGQSAVGAWGAETLRNINILIYLFS